MMNKKGVGWQYIVGLIVSLMVLGIVLFIIFKSKGSAVGWLDWVKRWI
jgi:hypothetical protein